MKFHLQIYSVILKLGLGANANDTQRRLLIRCAKWRRYLAKVQKVMQPAMFTHLPSYQACQDQSVSEMVEIHL